MPFVVGMLPLIGLSFLSDPSFHKWMVGVCLALALLAFVPGWRRHHRFAPAIIGLCGLSLISIAAFAGPEDCCAGGCEATVSPADNPGALNVVLTSGPSCASACCATEDTAPSTPAAITPSVVVTEEESSCTASCCATDNEAEVVEVATAGYIDLMWIVMTPLGGLFLVAGHLCNHRLSCTCAAGCCATPSR